jgi:hypothetical protein
MMSIGQDAVGGASIVGKFSERVKYRAGTEQD